MVSKTTALFRKKMQGVRAINQTTASLDVAKMIREQRHLVMVGGIGAQAALLKLAHYHPEMLPRCHYVGTRHWLTHCQESMKQCEWGQPFNYLNQQTFEIAKELFPDVDVHQKPTFEQMYQILLEQEARLKKLGINMIQEKIDRLEEDPSTGDLHVTLTDKRTIVLPTGGKHIVVNAARQNKIPALIAPEVRKKIQNAEQLYTKEAAQLNKIVIFGGGRNLDWAIRDLLQSERSNVKKIIHIIPPGDRPREDLAGIPNLEQIMLHDVSVQSPNNMVFIQGTDSAGKEVGIVVHPEKCFSAMGTEMAHSLTDDMDPDNVVLVDGHAMGGFEGGIKDSKRVTIQDTSMPLGNFTAAYFAIATTLGIQHPMENQAIIHFNVWMNDVIASMYSAGVINNLHDEKTYKILNEFADKLSVAIIYLYDSNKEFPTNEEISVYVNKIAEQTFEGENAQYFNHPVEHLNRLLGEGPLLLTP